MTKLINIAIFIAVLTAFALTGCKAQQPVEVTDYVMGTVLTQRIYGGNRELADHVTAQIRLLESQISTNIESSDISKISRAAGKSLIETSQIELIELSKEVSEKSHGAFDITVAPITKLWGIGTENARVPSKQEIEAVLPLVGYENIVLKDGKAGLTKQGAALDLGAIGKGAASDLALSLYKEKDITSAVVSVGGSIGLMGRRPDEKSFKIGLRDPFGSANQHIAVLLLEDISVSTSGSYEKYIEKNGIRYHHIIDPFTGYPAQSDLVSVTVIHKSGALCDALSTACFVLGYEKGKELLNEYGAKGIFIDKDKNIYFAGNLDNIFELKQDSGYRVVSR